MPISPLASRPAARRLAPPLLALLLAASGASAAGVSVDAATPEQSAAASEKFRAGTDALDAQKLTEALAFFRESYDVVASPNSRLMIGRVLARMGKPAEAYREIEAAAAEARTAALRSEKYRKTAESARADLEELRSKVGLVTVTLAGTFSVGGTAVRPGDAGKPIVVAPGTTEVVLRLPSGEEERRSVEVKAGEQTTVEIGPPARTAAPAPAPAPCPEAPRAPPSSGIDQRTLAWVAGGVGLAGMATFAVFGALDNKKYSELEKACEGSVCPRSAASGAETGRTYQTLANVGLGVGVVGLASGLVLAITAPGGKGAGRARRSPLPDVAVGPRSVVVSGSF